MPSATATLAQSYGSYAAIAVVGAFALVFVGGSMALVWFLTRRIRTPASRLTTYECGEEPVGGAWFRFNPRFYRIALIFLVCDALLALLLPALARLRSWAAEGAWLAPVLLLGGVLLCLGLGVYWAARRGDFDWSRSVHAGKEGPDA